MAKTLKSKKISITTLDKVMRETQAPVVNIDWHGVEITIKNTLPFRDVLAFVVVLRNLDNKYGVGT